ncbi:MAG: tetratricopeptide repeat-containing sensor histidine kinase [Imperialibacter sp.]|uniref:ATP-binding protein n=1 Tax=Imperialibacter sp. TaxID=2038411 RepID=UPI0032EF3975
MKGFNCISVVFCLALHANAPVAIGQSDIQQDLTEKLKSEKDSFKRVDLLNDLSYSYYDLNDTLARSYAARALQLAKSIDYPVGIKYATLLEGIGFFGKANFDSAVFKFRESLSIKDPNSTENDVYALALIGDCLTATAKYDSARQVFESTLPIAKKSGSYWLPRLYIGLGRIATKRWDNREALTFLDSARHLLNNTRTDFQRLELFTLLGEVYGNLLRVDESKAALDEMCFLADSIGDHYYLIKCDLQNTEFYYERGNFAEALRRMQHALELTKTYYYPVQQAELFIKAGSLNIQIAEFDLALDYFFKALEIAEARGLEAEIATIYGKIAWVFKEERKLDLATDYANRSLALSEKLGSRFDIAYSHNTLGLIFFLQNRFEESIEEFQLSLAIRREINYTRGVVATLFNESFVLEQLGDTEKALSQLLAAMEQAKPVRNVHSQVYLYRGAANLLMKMKRYDEAEDFLKRALEMDTMGTSRLSLRNTYQSYATLHEARGNFKAALEFRKKYEILNDSIFSENSANKIAELQGIYDLKQKEGEINGLKRERQLQEDLLQLQNAEIRDQKRQIYIVVIFLSLVSVFVAVMIYLYRRLDETQRDLKRVNEQLKGANEAILDVNNNLEQKVNERTSQLKQAYAELDTFFYRSSHDFRRPLTTLMGLADVARITIKNEQAIELFKLVRVTAENLDKMLYKLQSISDIGAMELSFKNVIVRDLIENCLEKHTQAVEELGVRVILDIQIESAITTYPALVSIILDNLIENALNFSSKLHPYIKINAFPKGQNMVIEVEDNGHGIPDQHRSNIFTMYFKATEKSKGNGLGLYIVAKAAEKLSAKIHVETAFDKGSRFIVEIPDCVEIDEAVLS